MKILSFLSHALRAPGLVVAVLLVGLTTSCFDGLNLYPKYGLNSATVYAPCDTCRNKTDNYTMVLAKIYGGLSLSGNQGPAGQGDISGDEGFSQYLRVLWNLQELPTEEALCAWSGDASIRDLNEADWNSQSSFVNMMYARIFYQVPLCNEFIYYCSEDWLADKAFSASEKATIMGYKAEARFMRALSYYHAIDLFGKVPLVTEEDRPGSGIPEQASRAQLFTYVESELKDIESLLPEPRTNQYGRVDKAAAWALLARLYLNAEVYINTPKYSECATYCQKVIDAGYSLEPQYANLFLADNHLATNEIIFAINFDGLRSQNYGGTTFLVKSSTPSAPTAAYREKRGTDGGWAGNRATPQVWNWFPADSSDSRKSLLDTIGMTTDISLQTDWTEFSKGVLVSKFCNKTRSGGYGNDPQRNFMDIDFPIFRLADVYLMYTEAVVRGGAGSSANAIEYYNRVQQRAYGNNSNNISALPTLNQLCDERGRELLWEGLRRTDLIRFNRFIEGDYLWPYKGGPAAGQAINPKFKVYPLPLSDIIANPNLTQNDGY